jgi:uncharacterized protein YdeI (YjbR/CyaY-like superfamily)
MSRDQRVEDYIGRKAEFAKPILLNMRETVHAACPEAEETIKWGAPAFMYKGEILGIMAAFKAHAVFNLWRGSQVLGETGKEEAAMGQFGRMTSVEDVPDRKTFTAILQKAMALVDSGAKPPRTKKEPKPALEAPDDLKAALAQNAKAAETFEAFSPSCRRDYVEWITEAKREETRAKRLAEAVAMMAEGKKRHWKYEKC